MARSWSERGEGCLLIAMDAPGVAAGRAAGVAAKATFTIGRIDPAFDVAGEVTLRRISRSAGFA
jgi:hypothetical protein